MSNKSLFKDLINGVCFSTEKMNHFKPVTHLIPLILVSKWAI